MLMYVFFFVRFLAEVFVVVFFSFSLRVCVAVFVYFILIFCNLAVVCSSFNYTAPFTVVLRFE